MSIRRWAAIAAAVIVVFILGVAVAPRVMSATTQGYGPYVAATGQGGAVIVVNGRGDVFAVSVNSGGYPVVRKTGDVRD